LFLGEDGYPYVKDTASSSGTFLNHTRLSQQNIASAPVKLRDGDCLQLGVEYRGGEEEVYRCVRMRIEIDRPVDQCKSYR
jgi:pSer/pThr/pTyr-binding forkhead associated (FHA) protein